MDPWAIKNFNLTPDEEMELRMNSLPGDLENRYMNLLDDEIYNNEDDIITIASYPKANFYSILSKISRNGLDLPRVTRYALHKIGSKALFLRTLFAAVQGRRFKTVAELAPFTSSEVLLALIEFGKNWGEDSEQFRQLLLSLGTNKRFTLIQLIDRAREELIEQAMIQGYNPLDDVRLPLLDLSLIRELLENTPEDQTEDDLNTAIRDRFAKLGKIDLSNK